MSLRPPAQSLTPLPPSSTIPPSDTTAASSLPTAHNPPKRAPRAAALKSREIVSTFYAPALLNDEADSDTCSQPSTTAAPLRHLLFDATSDSDSDEFVDPDQGFETGRSKSKRRGGKRKRGSEDFDGKGRVKRGRVVESLDREDLEVVGLMVERMKKKVRIGGKEKEKAQG